MSTGSGRRRRGDPLPATASPAATRIVVGRAARGFADGFLSVLLAQYLTGLGLTPFMIGAIVTSTLIGSALLTLAFGLLSDRVDLITLLLVACWVMAATGLGFALFTTALPLIVVAAIGTLNPSSGDVSVFMPTEQAILASEAPPADRPRLYAAYNVAGTLAGAVGALASAGPSIIAHNYGVDLQAAQRWSFVVYAAVAVGLLLGFSSLRRRARYRFTPRATRAALGASRSMVVRLAVLFSLDSAGSGFVVTSMLVLWLHARFGLSAGATATVFFAAGLLGGFSQFLAPRLARRIGLIRTMVFTHIPANLLLAATAFAPSGRVAVTLLLVRAIVAQMDVPARQTFVMQVVPVEHRAVAASVTNVPRSLASALTPLLAGALLERSSFGWSLLVAGVSKLAYDLMLLHAYRDAEAVSHPECTAAT